MAVPLYKSNVSAEAGNVARMAEGLISAQGQAAVVSGAQGTMATMLPGSLDARSACLARPSTVRGSDAASSSAYRGWGRGRGRARARAWARGRGELKLQA